MQTIINCSVKDYNTLYQKSRIIIPDTQPINSLVRHFTPFYAWRWEGKPQSSDNIKINYIHGGAIQKMDASV